MFLRRCYRVRHGRRYAYWALVESYRTARGSRQRVISYLGNLEEPLRRGILVAASGSDLSAQLPLPGSEAPAADRVDPEWVEVDIRRVRVERSRAFGGAWLALQIAVRLGLPGFLREQVPSGGEDIPWPLMGLVLVLGRLCAPGSELSLAEQGYERTALPELLGVPSAKVNDDRLYRALDRLLPSKPALEKHLKTRLGELFALQYDLLLYDVTSTFFEGQAERNPQAQRGYSRDQRPDCKQVCIALVVSREGIPLGYEVFAGNRTDVTTVEEIVVKIEAQYGTAERVWVMDRGMVSEANLEFLRGKQRRYIVGTPKSLLRRFEAELTTQGWIEIRAGLEVKLCPSPAGAETFILCRSADRREKERAMHARAAERLEAELQALAASCAAPKTRRTAPEAEDVSSETLESTAGAPGSATPQEAQEAEDVSSEAPESIAAVPRSATAKPITPRAAARAAQADARRAARAAQRAAQADARRAERAARAVGEAERRVGRLLEKYTRAGRMFRVEVRATADGTVSVTWERHARWSEWTELSDGCYLLRSNVTEWSAEELWKAYIQLTEAEAAFRAQKSDLELRPIWHQKEERVQAHILVCFLGYVLWKTLGKMCQAAGLGDEPRKVFQELSQLRMVDVVMPTRQGVELRRRCVERPNSHQAILLQRLGLQLPESVEILDV